jgi:hypothetical protein
VLTERLVGEPGQVINAAPGEVLPRPRWADAIETADGQSTQIGETLEAPARAGAYFLTRARRRVGAVVVNASAEESTLDRYNSKELGSHMGSNSALVAPDPGAWITMAFRAAARRSLIQPALIIALIMLVVEAIAIGTRGRQAA